jgi:hypothetical protein
MLAVSSGGGEYIMSNVVFYNSYKLKEGASVPDFLVSIDELSDEIMAKHKGVLSFTLLVDGDTWADYGVFETMDDLNNFLAASRTARENGTNDLAERFYSFCDFSKGKSHKFSVEIDKRR